MLLQLSLLGRATTQFISATKGDKFASFSRRVQPHSSERHLNNRCPDNLRSWV
jgi:hypothetical protein